MEVHLANNSSVISHQIEYLACKDPYLWKGNKASSRAEYNIKSAEVGTHKMGHWSDLSRGKSSE